VSVAEGSSGATKIFHVNFVNQQCVEICAKQLNLQTNCHITLFTSLLMSSGWEEGKEDKRSGGK
jgi:hypothetical protein